jgi:hypothetical protein
MDTQLLVVFALTFVIHLVGTLAYGVRIAGVRTRRITVSFALFNVLILVSRMASTFQAPLLAKRIETRLPLDPSVSAESSLRWLLLATTFATLAGALLVPSFHRVLTRAVQAFEVRRSVPRLILHSFSKVGILHLRESLVMPNKATITHIHQGGHIPLHLVLLNGAVEAVWTVSMFAALYAGCLQPQLRVTASSLSAIVNGGATVLAVIVIDPYLSIVTDDVLEGKRSEVFVRRSVVWLVGSRLAGTIASQLLLVPVALFIAAIARQL